MLPKVTDVMIKEIEGYINMYNADMVLDPKCTKMSYLTAIHRCQSIKFLLQQVQILQQMKIGEV